MASRSPPTLTIRSIFTASVSTPCQRAVDFDLLLHQARELRGVASALRIRDLCFKRTHLALQPLLVERAQCLFDQAFAQLFTFIHQRGSEGAALEIGLRKRYRFGRCRTVYQSL